MIHNQKMKSTAALCCLMAISAMTPASASVDTAVSGLQQLPTTVLEAVSGAVEIHDEASTGGLGYNLTGAFGTAGRATLTNSAGDGGVFALNASEADAVPISLTVAVGAKLFLYVDSNETAYNADFLTSQKMIENSGTVIVGAIPATIAVPAVP